MDFFESGREWKATRKDRKWRKRSMRPASPVLVWDLCAVAFSFLSPPNLICSFPSTATPAFTSTTPRSSTATGISTVSFTCAISTTTTLRTSGTIEAFASISFSTAIAVIYAIATATALRTFAPIAGHAFPFKYITTTNASCLANCLTAVAAAAALSNSRPYRCPCFPTFHLYCRNFFLDRRFQDQLPLLFLFHPLFVAAVE